MPNQPPEFRTTGASWLLTPLTDAQFTWIVNAIENERRDKAERIISTIADVPALADAAGAEEINPENVPVLEWASPKEFERVVDYASRVRAQRDKANMLVDTLMNLCETNIGLEKTERVIRETAELAEKLANIPDPNPGYYPPPETQEEIDVDGTDSLEPGILGAIS